MRLIIHVILFLSIVRCFELEISKLKFKNFIFIAIEHGLPEVEEVLVKKETVKTNLVCKSRLHVVKLAYMFDNKFGILQALNIVNTITKECLNKKIPLTMTVQRLKYTIVKMFSDSNFATDSIKLVHMVGNVSVCICLFIGSFHLNHA